MKKAFMNAAVIFCAACLSTGINAQNAPTKTTIAMWEGMVIAGYVNQGAYINFGGPCIRLAKKPWSVGFGILPSLRIKEDKVPKGATKNSIITPTAGFGFTFFYKQLVLQLPLYYNLKTQTAAGKWNPGIGIGYKL
jgi:hypothetical protein